MSTHILGEMAALGAALCWAVSALAFEAAGRRIGALSLNLIRLVLGLGFLSVAAWATRGELLPLDATPRMWLWLGLSGVAGFTFGDLCLFRAYVEIGSRLGTLTMLLVPLLTTALGWAVLGETLEGRDALGMLLTVAGVGWAILDRHPRERPGEGAPSAPPSAHPHLGRGFLLGFGGALGQAVGLVLSKAGMEGYPAIATAQVRVIAGLGSYVVIFTLIGWWGRVARAWRDRPALGYATTGAFFGPFVGVSLSLVAVSYTVSGVAATLMALTPIFVIPIVYLVRKERVGAGGIGGALVAAGGAALLLL